MEVALQQGEKANYTGQEFHKYVENHLSKKGHTCESPPKYEAIWGTGKKSNQADIYVRKNNTIIECKYQAVAGTVDQKPAMELWNAKERISCDHYILVLGGEHWRSGRGASICSSMKNMAKTLNASIHVHSGAKRVSVVTMEEFEKGGI
tara:strand:- start:55 stop:501 length:447 start_codon:yes stop_codon:yes gene_type:complete